MSNQMWHSLYELRMVSTKVGLVSTASRRLRQNMDALRPVLPWFRPNLSHIDQQVGGFDLMWGNFGQGWPERGRSNLNMIDKIGAISNQIEVCVRSTNSGPAWQTSGSVRQIFGVMSTNFEWLDRLGAMLAELMVLKAKSNPSGLRALARAPLGRCASCGRSCGGSSGATCSASC